ncbi:hypothetical protein [Streptomyces sp. PSKA30]|uniref:hypothetical protein n=1 Tax=Streptomyces sp. PSKA30 TaxID=2874597 RepID=UPI001CD04619|nr:hypothetical protein [Streptomyces sp. PSKA30]MBZ9644737.1 hypothetical protein [Streptomyces sp. PSKA30]
MEKDDELMAVLLGEPARGERGDAAERHAAAERDMAVVREQLRSIGDGLVRKAVAGQRPDPAPAAVPAPRRRRLGLFVLAASVAVALLGTGAAYLVAHNGAVHGGSDALLTEEGLVACSRDIAEGTVARVEQLGGDDRFRIVLDVDRSYKPENGERRLIFTDQGPNVPEYYKTGARMLVLVSSLPGEPPQTFRAGDSQPEGGSGPARDALDVGRQLVEQALPGAQDLACSGAG